MNADYFNTLAGNLGDIHLQDETELDIPFFLTPEWKRAEARIAEAEAARIAAAVGRERRKLRKAAAREAKIKRNRRIGYVGIPAVSMLITAALALVEIFCG